MPFAIAAGIGAIGSVAGGLLGAGAAKKASEQQAQATNWATQLQAQQYVTTQQNLNPFIGAGQGAIPGLEALQGQLSQAPDPFVAPGGAPPVAPGSYQTPGALSLPGYQQPAPFSFTQKDFQQSPGYQFQLQQGLQGVQNKAAASGDALGGNTLKALQTFGTGLANQDWYNAKNSALQDYTTNANVGLAGYQANTNTALNQYTTNANTGLAGYQANLQGYGAELQGYNSQFNNALQGYDTNFNAGMQQKNQLLGYLQNLAGSGQNAASGLASAGNTATANIGNLAVQGGNAQAAGTVGSVNALTQGFQGAANNLGALSIANPNAVTNSSNWLQNLFNGGSSGPSGVSPSVDSVLSNINQNPGAYSAYDQMAV